MFLVEHLEVVALEEGVDEQLPIRWHVAHRAAEQHVLRELEPRQVGVERRAQEGGDIAFALHVQPHEAVALGDSDWRQPCTIERNVRKRLAMRNVLEPALEIVRPAMIRAHERLVLAAAVFGERGSAMATGIEKPAQHTVTTSRDQHGRPQDIAHQTIADSGDFAAPAYDHRYTTHQRALALVDLGAAITLAGHADLLARHRWIVLRQTRPQTRQQLGVAVHV